LPALADHVYHVIFLSSTEFTFSKKNFEECVAYAFENADLANFVISLYPFIFLMFHGNSEKKTETMERLNGIAFKIKENIQFYPIHALFRDCPQTDQSHLLALFAIFCTSRTRLLAFGIFRVQVLQNLIENASKSA